MYPVKDTGGLKSLMNTFKGKIEENMANQMDIDRLTRVIITSMSKNPKLLKCTQVSIVGAIIESVQLGLMPDGILGEANFIPYSSKDGTVSCQFQIGYKGWRKLMQRQPDVSKVVSNCVYGGQVFVYSKPEKVVKEHEDGNCTDYSDDNIVGAYATIFYKDGTTVSEYWTSERIEEHKKKYSKAKDSFDNPWKSAKPKMYEKTVIIQLAGIVDINPEIQKAAKMDTMSETENQRLDTNLLSVNVEEEDAELASLIEANNDAQEQENQQESKQEMVHEAVEKGAKAQNSLKDRVSLIK